MAEIKLEKPLGFFLNRTLDEWLFKEPPGRDTFGIVLPLFAFIGAVTNILTVLVFQHKSMRGFSTLLLKANLIVDAVDLLFLTLIQTPKQWIYLSYEDGNFNRFWLSLGEIQNLFIRIYPLHMIISLCSQWYSMALTLEHYYAFKSPESLEPFRKKGNGLKVLIAIFNCTILVHITTFFKFVQEDIIIVHYPPSPATKYHLKILCLSDIYTLDGFASWDRVVYFAIFELLPWVVTLCCYLYTIVAYHYAKKSLKGRAVADKRILLPLKAGRCLRAVLTITGFYLVLKLISHAMYIVMIPYFSYEKLSADCFLTPVDTRAAHVPEMVSEVYIVANMLNSCIKPWLLLLTCTDMRFLIKLGLKHQEEASKQIRQRVAVIMDPQRHVPRSDEPYESHTGSEQTLSTDAGQSSAPY